MAGRRREVIWTLQAQAALDAAISYIAEDSLAAAQKAYGLPSRGLSPNLRSQGRLELPTCHGFFPLAFPSSNLGE